MAIEASLAAEDYCYITTIGRVSGKPHTIEIWFGVSGRTLYILAGGREKSDTVRNARKTPDVSVRIRRKRFAGRARAVTRQAEGALARRLLLEKYGPRYSGDLDEWGREALPLAFDLEMG